MSQQLGIHSEETTIQGFGDLPKLAGVDVPLLENLADGARVARQLVRQPDVGAPLPFQFGAYGLAYVREFVHAVCLLPSLCPQKATITKAWKLFALPSAVVLFLDYQICR